MQYFSGTKTRSSLVAIVMAIWLSTCSTMSQSGHGDASRGELVETAIEALVSEGDRAAQSGEFARALNFYSQGVELEESTALWFKIGRLHLDLGADALAWQAFNRVLQIDSRHAGAHEELGLMYLKSKRADAAHQHLEKAAEIDFSRWRTHNALGVLNDLAGEYNRARVYYQTAIQVGPKSAIVYNNLGYSYYMDGRLLRAEEIFREALKIDPGYKPAIRNLSLLHARRGEYNEAVEVLRQVAQASQAYNDIGYIALRNGDVEDARRLLQEAVRLSPQYYELANQNLKLIDEIQARTSTRSRQGITVNQRLVATVTSDESTVRSAPFPDAEVRDTISRGQSVEILYKEGPWSYVGFARASPDGIVNGKGWVREEELSQGAR